MTLDTTGATTSDDLDVSAPGSDTLPAGGDSLPGVAGIETVGASTSDDMNMGVFARGDAGVNGRYVDGSAHLYYNGAHTGSTSYDGNPYVITAVPAGVLDGASSADRTKDNRILNTTEAGGVDTGTYTGQSGTHYSSFSELAVTVLDADGQPVGGDRVVFDGVVEQTTGADGTLRFQSAGTVEIEALTGTVTDSVDLTDGPASRTYQYAGVEGTVATPDGDPIAGKTILLLDDDENIRAVAETNEFGNYRFSQVAPNTDLYVFNTPYFRPAPTRGQGQYVRKQFPSTVMDLGSVDDSRQIEEEDLVSVTIDVVDTDTGAPIVALPASVGDYDVESGPDGTVSATVPDAETAGQIAVTVTLGGDGRYRPRSFQLDRSNPTVGTIELQRAIRSDQT